MRMQWSMRKTIQTDHHTQINLHTCKRMMEIYESMLWWLANDLLGKVRHENDFLVLIFHHERFEVLHHNFMTLTRFPDGLVHVVGVRYRDVLFSDHVG